MVHPVQSVVESLYAAGRCPRLHVNSTYEGVECPDFIREQWQERLIIDLDTSYPLDLRFSDEGLSAELSFGGYITRCHFPWNSVYVVADRATGRGIVLDKHVPESVKQGREKPTTGPWTTKTDLRAVFEDKGNNPEDAKPDLASAPSSDTATTKESTPSTEALGEKKDEEVVKKRRAAFRVIDGGA